MSADATSEIVETLRTLSRQRRLRLADLSEVETALDQAIVAADQAKVPRLVIAREAGVARATVYKALERRRRAEA